MHSRPSRAAVLRHTNQKRSPGNPRLISKPTNSVRLSTTSAPPTQALIFGARWQFNNQPDARAVSSCLRLASLPFSRIPKVITATNYRCGPATGRPKCIVDLIWEPPCIVFHDCMEHELNGKRWVSLTARPQVTRDGRVLLSPKNGKPCYSACITFADKERNELFQRAALRAIDKLREGSK
jgi:hypothetical protein